MSLDDDCAAEQHQPVEEPVEDQVEQAKRHVHDHGLAGLAENGTIEPVLAEERR